MTLRNSNQVTELASRLEITNDVLVDKVKTAVETLESIWVVEPLDGDDTKDLGDLIVRVLDIYNGNENEN